MYSFLKSTIKVLSLLVIIYSCSENNTNDKINENNKPLIKSIKEISATSGLLTTFIYDGFKIKKAITHIIFNDNYEINYEYEGDLVVKEEGFLNIYSSFFE